MRDLPLAGKRFLVTRPQQQASDFEEKLAVLGAETVCIPTIEIVAPQSWQGLDAALRDLDEFDILILTSSNGVDAFFERLEVAQQYIGLLRQIFVVAVGPKTAAALQSHCISADLVPADHQAEGIVQVLLEYGVAGKRILYPRAEIARPLLVDSLRQAGAEVADPVAYRTVLPGGNAQRIRSCLEQGGLDAICFTSSSTFDNLLAMIGNDLHSLQGETRFFSIGPQTSATIRKHGFAVDLEPQQWTVAALVEAMADYYQTDLSSDQGV